MDSKDYKKILDRSTQSNEQAERELSNYIDKAREYLEWFNDEVINKQTPFTDCMDIAMAHWGDKGKLFFQTQFLWVVFNDLQPKNYKTPEAQLLGFALLTEIMHQLIQDKIQQ